MRILIVGPGRAGLALSIAAKAAGHEIVGVAGRDREHARTAAEHLGLPPFAIGDRLPSVELLVVATRDGDIAGAAAALANGPGDVSAAVHLSGLVRVAALAPLAHRGALVGAFHPLQTLPTPATGASRIAGAWVAITADEPLRTRLHELAVSLGAVPFDLADDDKPLYHSAAAAAANFTLGSLIIASDLMTAAGVPFEATRPLVEAVVANAYEIGPRPALTGPVVRGDSATVDAQLDAVAASAPQWLEVYTASVATLARIAGRLDLFADVLAADREAGDEAVVR